MPYKVKDGLDDFNEVVESLLEGANRVEVADSGFCFLRFCTHNAKKTDDAKDPTVFRVAVPLSVKAVWHKSEKLSNLSKRLFDEIKDSIKRLIEDPDFSAWFRQCKMGSYTKGQGETYQEYIQDAHDLNLLVLTEDKWLLQRAFEDWIEEVVDNPQHEDLRQPEVWSAIIEKTGSLFCAELWDEITKNYSCLGVYSCLGDILLDFMLNKDFTVSRIP